MRDVSKPRSIYVDDSDKHDGPRHMNDPEAPPKRLNLRPELKHGKSPKMCARCRLDCRQRDCPGELRKQAVQFDRNNPPFPEHAAYLRRKADIREEQLASYRDNRDCRECGGMCIEDHCPCAIELEADWFAKGHPRPGRTPGEPLDGSERAYPAKASHSRSHAAFRRVQAQGMAEARARREGKGKL